MDKVLPTSFELRDIVSIPSVISRGTFLRLREAVAEDRIQTRGRLPQWLLCLSE